MRSVAYKTETEYLPGNFSASLAMTFRDKKGIHRVALEAGTQDYLHVFRQGDCTYVVSINYGLPYVGLQVFGYFGDSGKKIESIGSFFLQEGQVEETLGKDGENKAPYWIAKILAEHIQ